MFEKLRAAAQYFASEDHPGRSLKVYPDDVFLVSYPKSGNTWIRFLVANLVYPEAGVTLLSADQLIPFVEGRSRKFFNHMPRPRVIKSHFPFHQSYKKVVYVVRDPRDTVLSQYHFQIKRGVLPEGAPLEPYVSRFIAGEVCPYGSWGENVISWVAARRTDPNFVLIRYEDLLRQTVRELERIAKLMGIESTPESLALAVERSTADRMRKIEKVEGSQWESTKGTRQDISFIRAAKDRQWQTALPEQCIFQIENAWGALMKSLGYSLELVRVPPMPQGYESALPFDAIARIPA